VKTTENHHGNRMHVIYFDSKGQLRHLLALFSRSRTRPVCKCMQKVGERTTCWGNTACCLWWSRRDNAVTRCRFGRKDQYSIGRL